MFKTLGIIVGGIFAGAVAMEIMRRKCPNAWDKIYSKSREIASEAKEAFKNGYEKATLPQEAVRPSS